MYINGLLVLSGSMVFPEQSLTIGSDGSTSWVGLIDDVAVFSSVLSVTDLQLLKNGMWDNWGIIDTLGLEYGQCEESSPLCFQRLPRSLLEGSTSVIAIDTTQGKRYKWDFDQSLPASHAAWTALHDHKTVPTPVSSSWSGHPLLSHGKPPSEVSFAYTSRFGVKSVMLGGTGFGFGQGLCVVNGVPQGSSSGTIGSVLTIDSPCSHVSQLNGLQLWFNDHWNKVGISRQPRQDPVGPAMNISTSYLSSCAEIRQQIPTAVSGLYLIVRPGSLLPMTVYCDMEVLGGGWTRLAASSGLFQATTNGWTQILQDFNGFMPVGSLPILAPQTIPSIDQTKHFYALLKSLSHLDFTNVLLNDSLSQSLLKSAKKTNLASVLANGVLPLYHNDKQTGVMLLLGNSAHTTHVPCYFSSVDGRTCDSWVDGDSGDKSTAFYVGNTALCSSSSTMSLWGNGTCRDGQRGGGFGGFTYYRQSATQGSHGKAIVNHGAKRTSNGWNVAIREGAKFIHQFITVFYSPFLQISGHLLQSLSLLKRRQLDTWLQQIPPSLSHSVIRH